MSRKKKSYKPNPYLSVGGENDSFTLIYGSLLRSEAFKRLTAAEKHVAMCCFYQVQDQDSKRCLHELWKDSEKEVLSGYFVFPASHMAKYGINQGNGSRTLDKLCHVGFIKLIEQNKNRRLPNVYSLDDQWKKQPP